MTLVRDDLVASRHHHQRPADPAQAAELVHHGYRQPRRLLRGLRDRRARRVRRSRSASRDQFKEATRTKLVLEIAGHTPKRARHSGAGARAAHLVQHRRTDVARPLGQLALRALRHSTAIRPHRHGRGLSRPSRLGRHSASRLGGHSARLSGMPGTRPGMTVAVCDAYLWSLSGRSDKRELFRESARPVRRAANTETGRPA